MIKIICEQRSEAWYQARLARVTGTAFGDLMAKKDTTAYTSLVYNIASEIITETKEDEENYVSDDMQRGIDLEPTAANCYAEITGYSLEEVGFITPDETSKYYEWVGVSPDRLIDNNGILEIKCPKRKTHLQYIERGVLPSQYKHQVQGQLFVTGLEFCDFMSFCEGMKPFIIRVYPDKELHEQYEAELDILIEAVKQKISIYKGYSYE